MGRLRGWRQPMSALVKLMNMATPSPVVDQTGLSGFFNFSLEYTMERSGIPPDVGAELPGPPSVFDAIQRQPGLKVSAAKVPFPVVVVESLSKTPSEN